MIRDNPAAPVQPPDGAEPGGGRPGNAQPDEAHAPPSIRHVALDGGGEFRIERDGHRIAELTYTVDGDGAMVIQHTHVSNALRGQGIALQLTRAAVEHARRDGLQVVPVCAYARAAIERHHDLQDVLKS